MHNKPYLLALNQINGLGTRTILKLLQRWPNLTELFAAKKESLLQKGLQSRLVDAIAQVNWPQVEEELRWENPALNQHILTCDAQNYPPLLRELPDYPPLIYARGDLDCFKFPALAIVGSRKPSPFGVEMAFKISAETAAAGLTIVSGLAAGIDAQAHRGCLQAQGRTIAVMGTGMSQVYPKQHRQLAGEICEKGLLVSELPLHCAPRAGQFPRRNRIISGLAKATLVVEAAIKSGSLITARLALEQNRDVLAIPGSIYNPQARGCNFLIKEGAKVITCTDDILEEFSLKGTSPLTEEDTIILASQDKNLVKCIGFEITTFDQICQRSGLEFNDVACRLVDLELLGIIKAVSGGYMRCL